MSEETSRGLTERTPTAGVSVVPMFLDRWSPRAFDPAPLDEADVAALLEAARWAPSAANEQPWHIWYADTEGALARYRSILVDSNRVWADHAPLLLFFGARRTSARTGKENRWHAFDAGAAWMSLALAARQRGLFTHAMGGFDLERAYEILGADHEAYDILAAVVVGRPSDPQLLPDDLREREKPSDRRPVDAWTTRG